MFIDVILPLALKELLSYRVPRELEGEVRAGVRVAVELGKRKVYSAIVYAGHSGEREGLRPIAGVLDKMPVVTDNQVRLWEWVASYYMCSLGEVMKNFFPGSMKMSAFKDMLDNGYCFDMPCPGRKEKTVALHPKIETEEELHVVLDSLKRAKMQYRALSLFIEKMGERLFSGESLPRSLFLESGIKPPVLSELQKKEILVLSEESVMPDNADKNDNVKIDSLPELTFLQNKTYESVKETFGTGKSVLLYGVSGAGKTEVYMHLIRDAVEKGGQVLLLIPETALTAQLVGRLEHHFGDLLVVYNSRISPSAKHRIYNEVLHCRTGQVVVGTRSAVSLPFNDLRLVVVDEEQDAGYKQNEPSPRFHARDTALMAAKIDGADVLLVSATPSLESYYNAMTGKYALVRLEERYNRLGNPKVTVIDRRTIAVKEKKEKGYTPDTRYFSKYLLKRIGETLERGEQVILFQNRRGFSSYVECADCGEVPGCPSCNVSLTYHKYKGTLECHYCGYTIPAVSQCPACGSYNLLSQGIGTENIEEKIKRWFPDTVVERVDADVLKSVNRFRRVLSRIENGEAGIIVGTQMISKGFDFPSVSLVGIINADNILGFPDFRNSERGFQLLAQISGRVSRGTHPGEVIIQSSRAEGTFIADIARFSYEGMYQREIKERERFMYPPFFRLIGFSLKHTDSDVLHRAADEFAAELQVMFGKRVVGPVAPLVDKVRNFYILDIILKIERGGNIAKAKRMIAGLLDKVRLSPVFKGVVIIPNADM